MANPLQVRAFFAAARERLGDAVELTAHFHNTRGQGLANVLAALEAGLRRASSRSFGELGGCPVPAGRDRQHRHRGPRLDAARDGDRDRHRPRARCSRPARAARDVLGRAARARTRSSPGPVDWHAALTAARRCTEPAIWWAFSTPCERSCARILRAFLRSEQENLHARNAALGGERCSSMLAPIGTEMLVTGAAPADAAASSLAKRAH